MNDLTFHMPQHKRGVDDRNWTFQSTHEELSIIGHCGSHNIISTGHSIKWDHHDFESLTTGRLDVHCKIKETLLIKDLKPALNENVGSEKLVLY